MISDYIGLPFKDGGRGPKEYDCWGLAMAVMKNYGYYLPDYHISAFDAAKIAFEIKSQRCLWTELKQPVKGCVVVMRFGTSALVNHVGVYIGNGRFVHAREKTGSCIERLDNPVFKKLVAGFYLPPEEYKA